LRLLDLPGWIIEELMLWLPVIQADELYSAALVSMLPHMKDGDRRRVLNKLTRVRTAKEERPQVEIIEENPQKARAWFAAMGAKVVNRGR
jgi:hypothetical protein